MDISKNALKVLEHRYLLRNDDGKVIETPDKMFKRVAKAISAADKKYKENASKSEKEFYSLMSNLEFLPNSPTLMNAGAKNGQLAACFVLPIEDSIESIFETLKDMAKIHQSGGGVGYNFSKIRPKGDIISTTKGHASGPVSFMTIFDKATDVIKQGGKRRGANMGILNINHPDIMEFIVSKRNEGVLKNFNISAAINEDFMKAAEEDKEISLINPKTKKAAEKVKAKKLFNLICRTAWECGDPGVIFIDEINRHNPLKKIGLIESTNPCGEVPLFPYESCTLGSINLSKFVKGKNVDFGKLKKAVHTAVHFLDNVIDANKYPIPEIEKISLSNRKIGLGVMGFADMLIKLGIPYDSKHGLEIAEKIMKFITEEAREKSEELGKKRGSFANFKKSELSKRYKHMRNATVTTIAPTGTLSLIADCSSGIEPLFGVVFEKSVLNGEHLVEVNPLFLEMAKKEGFYSKTLIDEAAKKGSVKDIKSVPEKFKRIFASAHDIGYEQHVWMQAAFQKYTNNAVSKTVNLNNDASADDIKNVFLLAYKLKCKGITVYREGSKREQIINIGKSKNPKVCVECN